MSDQGPQPSLDDDHLDAPTPPDDPEADGAPSPDDTHGDDVPKVG